MPTRRISGAMRHVAKAVRRFAKRPTSGSGRRDNAARRRIAALLWRKTGGRVFAGPFARMMVPLDGGYAHEPSMVIGGYESELHPTIEAMRLLEPDVVVNIGAADGYYAVGMALILPRARVVAFEADGHSRRTCRSTADLNGVSERVDIRGACRIEDLAALGHESLLVISDCEGAEYDLLNPGRAEALRRAHVICEVHECLRAGVVDALVQRFRQTHHIAILSEGGRHPASYRILREFSNEDASLALWEDRHIKGVPFSAQYIVLAPM